MQSSCYPYHYPIIWTQLLGKMWFKGTIDLQLIIKNNVAHGPHFSFISQKNTKKRKKINCKWAAESLPFWPSIDPQEISFLQFSLLFLTNHPDLFHGFVFLSSGEQFVLIVSLCLSQSSALSINSHIYLHRFKPIISN